MTYEELKMHLGSEVSYSGIDIVFKIWESIDEGKNISGFFGNFLKGFQNRPSVRTSNPTKTVSDPLVDSLLKAKIPSFSDFDIDLIRFGHRASMAAENITGLILEEYVHDSLIKYGWSCCWGNCIKAVDLCSNKGDLIQLKNKSNTENSSSNKIRVGTEIKKWYRFNAYNGSTCWNELNAMTNTPSLLSEEKFREFAYKLVKANPDVLYVNTSELNSVSKAF